MNTTKEEFIARLKAKAKAKQEHGGWIERHSKSPRVIKLPKVKEFDPDEIIIIKEENNETKN